MTKLIKCDMCGMTAECGSGMPWGWHSYEETVEHKTAFRHICPKCWKKMTTYMRTEGYENHYAIPKGLMIESIAQRFAITEGEAEDILDGLERRIKKNTGEMDE